MSDNLPPPIPVAPAAAPAPAPAAAPAPAEPGSLSELLKTPDRYSRGIVGGGDLGPRVGRVRGNIFILCPAEAGGSL